MNKVILVGRLCSAPELRYVGDKNSALTRFTDPLIDGIFDYDKLDKILKDKYILKVIYRKTSQMIKI